METVSRRPTVSRDINIEERVEAGRGKRGNRLCCWTTRGAGQVHGCSALLQHMKPSMRFSLKFVHFREMEALLQEMACSFHTTEHETRSEHPRKEKQGWHLTVLHAP